MKSVFAIILMMMSSSVFAEDKPYADRPRSLVRPCNLGIMPFNTPSYVKPRAFREMKNSNVEYIVVRPSLMPYLWGPRQVQNWAMRTRRSCDIGFHFGVFPALSHEPAVFALRSLRVQGAFLRGSNNNIGVLVHGWSIDDAQPMIIDLVEHLIEEGSYPNLKGVVTAPDASQGIKKSVREIDRAIFGDL